MYIFKGYYFVDLLNYSKQIMPFLNYFKPDFYNEKSVLTARELVVWKRKNNAYNFDTIPKVAVISIVSQLSLPKRLINKKLKGLIGKNYILNNKVLFSYDFGIGSPAIIALLEELTALGVTKILYLGYAGRLDTTINEADCFIVNKAFSLCGTSFFYNKDSFISYSNNFFEKVKSELNLTEQIVLSTDAPYRETQSILESYKIKKATLIDMETASILAFSKKRKTEVACVLIASDQIENSWTPPKDILQIHKKTKQIVNQFITKL